MGRIWKEEIEYSLGGWELDSWVIGDVIDLGKLILC